MHAVVEVHLLLCNKLLYSPTLLYSPRKHSAYRFLLLEFVLLSAAHAVPLSVTLLFAVALADFHMTASCCVKVAAGEVTCRTRNGNCT